MECLLRCSQELPRSRTPQQPTQQINRSKLNLLPARAHRFQMIYIGIADQFFIFF